MNRNDEIIEFTLLFNKFKKRLYNYVLKMSADRMLTDDIVQDVFIKLYQNMDSIRNKQSIQFWLFKSARNELYTILRNTKLKKLFKYLEEYLSDRTTLKPGVLASDFYLQDINNKFTTLNKYKGNIVLLNFWFPGCKPCINEIPYERKLVDEFENKNFKLLNICFFSSEEDWRKTIEKFEMKGEHFFANENWQKILIEKYKLGSYPSYILIDETGKIISSSPKRPSEGIGDEITKLLAK